LGSVRGHSTPWWALSAACALVAAVLAAAPWPRIHTFGWFSLYAEPPNGPGGAPGNETNWGLLDWRGDRKPAYAALKRG